jgi:uncharacterized protein (DUF305 family)
LKIWEKALIQAGIGAILLACNNNSNPGPGADHSNHASHNKTADHKTDGHTNAIHDVMNTMMQAMHSAKPTGNNDIDFATMMIEHHKGAVQMSKVELAKGNNAELKAFAQKVIDDQNREIKLMEEAISTAPKTASKNSADFQKALNSSMIAMMTDTTASYNDIDKDFAAQMIPHHQSAVDMAKAYLDFGQDASFRTLCQNIISSQTEEINWLKQWLVKNGKQK